MWDRFRTISKIASQKGEEYEKTKRTVFAALSGDDVETNGEGEVALHGRTELFWTTAQPAVLDRSL